MKTSDKFIARLETLKPGDLARLRQHAGRPLDESLNGFDLFTGLWWPLRQTSPETPERRSSWLVAKLFGAFPMPHSSGVSLPSALAGLEPREERERARFRRRMDALLSSSLANLEPRLRWALGVVWANDFARQRGVDWAQLLDDLSAWDRGEKDTRAEWAKHFLCVGKERD
ncbi:MAG TPA: type I-E CRISPR-associated protein Cse2/CasB [Candidatus Brocadiia bacterium]|nr:type I-E CRISPR-associated protein Cse2/CasB [Candidatus Brocadiia bacterium]